MGIFFGGRRRRRSLLGRLPLIRWVGPALTLAGFLGVAYTVVSGRVDLTKLDRYRGVQPPPSIRRTQLESIGGKSDQTVRIATFHIQVFGERKSSDPEVMPLLAQILLQFDVVAVQGIRARNSLPVERLVELVNRSGSRYRAITSEPIGRDQPGESYAFVWDDERILWEADSAYIVRDDNDRMQRQPLVATFEARTAASDGRRPFRFTLINVRADPESRVSPDAPEHELNVLDDVFHRVREYEHARSGQTDVILLGALYEPADRLGDLGKVPFLTGVLTGTPTTTRGTKVVDHILFDRRLTREFTGQAGVLDFVRDLGVSPEMALRVSDQLPLWAEFAAYQVDDMDAASRPPVTTR